MTTVANAIAEEKSKLQAEIDDLDKYYNAEKQALVDKVNALHEDESAMSAWLHHELDSAETAVKNFFARFKKTEPVAVASSAPLASAPTAAAETSTALQPPATGAASNVPEAPAAEAAKPA